MSANPGAAMSGEHCAVPGTAKSQHGAAVTSEGALSRHDSDDDDRGVGERTLSDAFNRTGHSPRSADDAVSAAAVDERLASVNECLRAENEAFRASIDTNVRLRSVVSRLENASRELETNIRSLEAEVLAARGRSAAQSLHLAELERCIADAEKSVQREQLQQQLGEISGNDAAARINHEQNVADLTALVRKLQEDREIKLKLLETREEQLREKQALYEDLAKRQQGHVAAAEPLQTAQHQQQHQQPK